MGDTYLWDPHGFGNGWLAALGLAPNDYLKDKQIFVCFFVASIYGSQLMYRLPLYPQKPSTLSPRTACPTPCQRHSIRTRWKLEITAPLGFCDMFTSFWSQSQGGIFVQGISDTCPFLSFFQCWVITFDQRALVFLLRGNIQLKFPKGSNLYTDLSPWLSFPSSSLFPKSSVYFASHCQWH